MKKLIYSFLMIQALLFSGCGNGEKKHAEASEAGMQVEENNVTISQRQFEEGGLTLGSLEKKSFPLTIQVNGMIDVPPENKAVVSALMGGYIKRTPLLIGDLVKKGQVLVTIENPEFVRLQQEYMEVKERLVFLKSEYQRQQTLLNEKITSEKSFLKSESEYKTANARYGGLKKQLSMLNISPELVEKGEIVSTVSVYAPISGSITKMNVTKGTYVSPSSPILEIIDNDHIHIELSVFEKNIMKVKKGQTIHFTTPEASDETFEAEVYLIGTSIGENRTIKVHGHLKEEEKNRNFLTGMFVNANIVTDQITALALPSSAVVEQEGKFFILRKVSDEGEDYSFEPVHIQVEATADGTTAIKDVRQFSASDKFLINGAFDLIGS